MIIETELIILSEDERKALLLFREAVSWHWADIAMKVENGKLSFRSITKKIKD